MQVKFRYKRASMSHKSLDVDLTVDKNLALKFFHHYLVKLCNPLPLDVSTVGFTSKGLPRSLACLHLRLTFITVVPYNSYQLAHIGVSNGYK
jgi:hypothetical protein